MLRVLTGGESHGPACTAIIEGLPAGIRVSLEDINLDLKRRRSDYGRGGRGRIEADRVEILSGVRYGLTLGSPVTVLIRNRDFGNWRGVMDIAEGGKAPELTCPRPGHADLAGAVKYNQSDLRNIAERASARETVARVAAGAVVRGFLGELGLRLASHTIQIGAVKLERQNYDFTEVAGVFATDPAIRCLDTVTSRRMRQAIRAARTRGDTLGGAIEVIATGVPVGLGSVMHYDRRLDARLAGALMSIPSVKAVEIGNAIAGSARPGSSFQDIIVSRKGRLARLSNNAGGIEGGMSNGRDIVCRLFLKPLATTGTPLPTVDIATGQTAAADVVRSDVCAVPRAGVVAEAMMSLVLGDCLLEKCGGDHIEETRRNLQSYIKSSGCR
jgi:chorismate synthase